MKFCVILWLFFICGYFSLHSLFAETVDKIVGIVGPNVITQSELEQAMLLSPFPQSDSIRLNTLNQLIEHNLLLIQAEQETLEVSDEEISSAVNSAMLEVRGRFSSDEIYEEELRRAGFSEEDLRNRYTKEVRENLLIQKLFQKKFGKELAVGDIEALSFYNTYKDSIPPEPAGIKFSGVFVPYEVSIEAQSIAEKKAKKILNRIKKGEPFEKLAREYSDNEATRDMGGDLGILNQRDLSKGFQEVILGINVGELSITRIQDTYHIIRCDEKSGDIVHLRDIMVKIFPTQRDSQTTRQRLELVKEKLKTGDPIDSLNVRITSRGENFIPLSETSFSSLESVKVGEIYTFSNPNGFELIKPLELRPERELTWSEIRLEFKQLVYQRKLNYFYQKLVSELKEDIFVKIML